MSNVDESASGVEGEEFIIQMIVKHTEETSGTTVQLASDVPGPRAQNAQSVKLFDVESHIDEGIEKGGKIFYNLESKSNGSKVTNAGGSTTGSMEADEILTDSINIRTIESDLERLNNGSTDDEYGIETYTIEEVIETQSTPIKTTGITDISTDIAKKQLQALSKDRRKVISSEQIETVVKRKSNIDHNIKSKENGQDKNVTQRVRAGVKAPTYTLSSPILSKAEIEKEIKEKLLVSDKKVDKQSFNIVEYKIPSGKEKISFVPCTSITRVDNYVAATSSNDVSTDIEIPEEFILSDYTHDNEEIVTSTRHESNNEDDLLAILEGDEDEQINKSLEKQIALNQIQSLKSSSKKRKEEISKSNKKSNKLVDSLVLDWSDNETEHNIVAKIDPDENIKIISVNSVDKKSSTPPASEIKTEKKENKITEVVEAQPTTEPYKRSRIIKKKIIWDPDAPETQFSYASLIQGSNTTTKKPVVKKTVVVKVTKDATNDSTTKTTKRKNEESSISPPVKKKRSEINNLLGDEGVLNMLQALEKENANDDEERKKRISKPRITPTVELESLRAVSPKVTKSKLPKSVSPKPVVPKAQSKKKNMGEGGHNSWDYVYEQRGGDESMIIRRRSNSSYSSSSPRRLSLDTSLNSSNLLGTDGKAEVPEKDDEEEEEKSSTKKSSSKNKNNNFEFAKPKDKKTKTKIIKSSPTKSQTKKVTSTSESLLLTDKHLSFEIKRFPNYVEFDLTEEDSNSYLTPKRMEAIIALLNDLENDVACKGVLISSDNSNFCHGIDVLSLQKASSDEFAKELSMIVYNFIKALLHFTKPLIASVQGHVTNIGVTILPLFDIVVSDMTSVFQCTYGKIGQIPEGWSIINNCSRLHQSAVRNVFFLLFLIVYNCYNVIKSHYVIYYYFFFSFSRLQSCFLLEIK